MGMTADEYWCQDVWLVVQYKKAYKQRKTERNTEMWLQGFYIYDAFRAVIESAFSKGEVKPYMRQPIELYPKKLTSEEKEAQAERIREEYYQRLKAWGDNWNERHEHIN